MKKFFSALVALGILITLVGCSSSDCRTITVSIHGGMDTGKITPNTVAVKAGQFVTITTDGAIYRKPALGDPSIVNLEEVIRLSYADKNYQLAIGGKTEIKVEKDGAIEFSLHRIHLPGTNFITGKTGKKFKVGDAVLKICFSEKSQGGSPPREIKRVPVPSLDGVAGYLPFRDTASSIAESLTKAENIIKSAKEKGAEWVEANQADLPIPDVSKLADAFQAWEKETLREAPAKTGNLFNRLFKDPLYASFDDPSRIDEETMDLVIETALALWSDPVVQTAISDPGTFTEVFDDLRVTALIANPHVKVLLSDHSRMQKLFNDVRVRDIVNNQRVRAGLARLMQ